MNEGLRNVVWHHPRAPSSSLQLYLPQRPLAPAQFEKVENKPVVVGYIAGAAAAIIIAEWLIHLPALDIVSLSLSLSGGPTAYYRYFTVMCCHDVISTVSAEPAGCQPCSLRNYEKMRN